MGSLEGGHMIIDVAADLIPGLVTGEYVPLGVEEFNKAFANFLHVMAGLQPEDEGFEPGPQELPDGGTIMVEDTPFNRAMHTAAGLLPDLAKRQSFLWRVAIVLGIARDKKYAKYRNDDALSMHLALLTTICMVRGSQRTPKKALRANFDIMFRAVLKETEAWAKDNPGYFRQH
jgi:hypothetical protein